MFRPETLIASVSVFVFGVRPTAIVFRRIAGAAIVPTRE
jgi:hypothetical protein